MKFIYLMHRGMALSSVLYLSMFLCFGSTAFAKKSRFPAQASKVPAHANQIDVQANQIDAQAIQIHAQVTQNSPLTKHVPAPAKHVPALAKHVTEQEKHIADQENHLPYVDPFIGTTKSGVLTRWGGNGGTYPGAVAPSGAIQLSPETRVTGAKGYDYTDHQIYFFSCIKHYSGFPEGSAGHLFIMPVRAGKSEMGKSGNFEAGKVSDLDTRKLNYFDARNDGNLKARKDIDFEAGITSRPFKHQDETAHPGYYKVVFKDDHTVVEASATIRTGIFRITFPKGVVPRLFLGDAGEISFIGKRTLHATLANAVINFNADLLEKKQVKGGYLFTFPAKKACITVKISSSTVDYAAAQHNIDTEVGVSSFEQIRARTAQEWKTQLSTVDITDSDQENKTVFYTALYHSLLIPWVISDSDGQYRGADGIVHQTKGKYQYGGFSPWDTFRSLHPLLSLLYPEKQQDAILSMLDFYNQTGHLPIETMTGNHAVPIIVDAYLKGITGFDKTLAYKAMKSNLTDSPFVQRDMEIYHRMGYVPFSNAESVTRTVEYAYNDWALGQYAKQVMGDNALYQLEQNRGFNYRNLFHSESLFMLPRMDNDFKLDPGMTGYKEGNKWVYSWFVPHNSKDLVNLMGGNAEFSARLDSAMTKEVVLYDNETVLHLPYLFNTAGYPNLTQKWIRDILVNRFKATPAGLPGNDDLGSMSSAYVFNAMGLFPISPGRPLYAIGAPLFQSLKLHLAHKKTFTIEAKGQSRENKYVQSLQLNHEPYENLVLNHDLMMKGGAMEFVMSRSVSESWPKDRDPVALSETKTAADIHIVNYQVGKNKVAPDEQFWIYFNLENTGSSGTRKIILYAAGEPLLFKHVLVPAGARLKDSISCRLYNLGKITIGLEAEQSKIIANKSTIIAEENRIMTGKNKMITQNSTVITVAEPAKTLSSPYLITELKFIPLVHRNELQKISYMLQNLRGRKQEFRIPLSVDDQLILTDTIVLMPGEKKQIEHSFVTPLGNPDRGIKTLAIGSQMITDEAKRFTNNNDRKQVALGRATAKFKIYDTHYSSLLLDLSMVKNEKDTLFDRSGFGNNALINDKARDVNTLHPSKIGDLILLGEHRFAEIPNSASFDQMGESLTMMCWVYPESGNDKGLVDMFTKGDHHVLQTNNNKTLSFFAGGWGRGDITIDLPANWEQRWHHLAGVCKGDMLWLYIDGKLSGTAKVDGAVNLSTDSKWQLGGNEEFPSERLFHGYMDLVKVFEQPLTANEINTIINTEKDLLKKPKI